MRKTVCLATLLTAVTLFQYCTTSHKAVAKAPDITFNSNIKPIIEASCAPCHTGDKKEALTKYDNAKNHAAEIIERIQKNPGEHGFMPVRGEKLAVEKIQAFKDWQASGLSE